MSVTVRVLMNTVSETLEIRGSVQVMMLGGRIRKPCSSGSGCSGTKLHLENHIPFPWGKRGGYLHLTGWRLGRNGKKVDVSTNDLHLEGTGRRVLTGDCSASA